jgi:hypothetical protein
MPAAMPWRIRLMKNNSGFPNRAVVEARKAQYTSGCRVELVSMDDPCNTKLNPGEQGTVKFVDDTGTVFVAWDCGSSLGAVYGVDQIRKVGEL